MAQIFVSHSAKDKDIVNFFSKAFAGTKVKAIFEEFESILTGKITSSKVSTDIESSNALFVILSKNVQNIPYTRDWVLWETGVAKNKDIWVFEPYSQFGAISVVIPHLRHYLIFGTTDDWLGYIRRIIESYDDSHILPTSLLIAIPSAVVGGILGGLVGGMVGAVLANTNQSKVRPTGLDIICANCHSSYSIHIPQGMCVFRCPVCNTYFRFGDNTK